jgi:asparagine synthetase B (glutamine-hydrolysing)
VTVTVSFTDPLLASVQSPDGHWFASGVPLNDLESAAAGPDTNRAVADLIRRHRAGSVTAVLVADGHAHRLISAKGIVGTHERFLVAVDSGWYVTDHFRNAISRVPPADRHPGELGLAEHYLFRAIHEDRTYSVAVDRVTHGQVMTIDLRTNQVSKSVVDRLFPPVERLSRREAVDRLDAALAEATRIEEGMGRAGVLFSGGVDSTVLLTYLHPHANPVTWVPDTPEFAEETERARSTARLIGAVLDEALVEEGDYPGLLREATELMGWPCMHHGTPMFNAAYDRPYDTLFMGEGSDALFGVGMRLARVAAWLSNPVTVALLRKLQDKGPSRFRYRFGQLYDAASRLRMPVGPRSYALASAGSPTADELAETLGMDVVLAALEAKLRYVEERVEIETSPRDRVTSNFEYRHWAFTLADPLVVERHQAQGRGKALINPFGAPEVIAAAHAVPPTHRYVHRLRGKYLVKEVLQRRLPPYPVDQRKGHTAIPFRRFYEMGPLRDFWNQYDVPSMFRGAARDRVVAGGRLTWQAMAFAVWDAQVASHTSLAAHPAKTERTIA